MKKKTLYYKEREEEKRRKFLEELEKIPEENRVYIDESGIDRYLTRKYARSIKGVKVYGATCGLRYCRESFIAGKVGSKILAPFCYKGTCNTQLFNLWLEDFLIPELNLGQVVIMDNATFHQSQKSQELIKNSDCQILFLPPYSPDLNPIEKFWANFKKLVQLNLEKIQTLSEAIDFSFLTVLGTI